MANNDTGGQRGPIIDRDKRETKPYSKRIIFFGLLLVAAIIIVISTQAQKSIDSRKIEQPRTYDPPSQNLDSMLTELMNSAKKPPPPQPPPRALPPPALASVPESPPPPPPPPRQPRLKYYSNPGYKQVAQQLKTMDAEAIKSQPVVDGFGDIGIAAAGGGTQPLLAGIQQQRGTGSNPQIPTALAALAQQLGGGDPNRQDQKEDFLRNTGATLTHQGYSGNMPLPQQFDLELKAGTVIPGMLVTGVNSDLPGPVMGQVSENVWDSTHGRYVLIPKGTRVLGVYDSQIVYGQKRVLVVWNRLVFPNGTTLNIAGSAGLDQSGYSGLTGKVNEHWDRMIKTALLATLFVTGAEMISPRENRLFSNNQAKSPGEIASEQAANSILDMSSKLMNKNMDIQPTITIRPGRRFNIFVEKDIVFPDPYPIEFK